MQVDFPEHASETAGVWDSLAEWWDDAIGDGAAPATIRLTSGRSAGGTSTGSRRC